MAANNVLSILGDNAPMDFDIIADIAVAHEGHWTSIVCYEATFPANTSGNIINGAGKDLSPLNDQLPEGAMLMGAFTRITLSGGLVVAYKKRQS